MKTVFITGGNRGIGKETARQLGKKGFKVIIGCRRAEDAQKAVAELQKGGVEASFTTIDVLSDRSVEAAAADVSSKCNGALDVLINNAGCNEGRTDGSTLQVNLEAMLHCYEVNVIGLVRVTNNFIEMVKKAPAGRVVNVGSIMGSCAGCLGNIPSAPYNASKAALNMYTVNLAAALKGTNVKVNVGHPGWVRTDMGGLDANLSVEEGAETNVYLATLPADGPTGGFFHKQDRLPW